MNKPTHHRRKKPTKENRAPTPARGREYEGEQDARVLLEFLGKRSKGAPIVERLLDKLVALIRPSSFGGVKLNGDAQQAEGPDVRYWRGDKILRGSLYQGPVDYKNPIRIKTSDLSLPPGISREGLPAEISVPNFDVGQMVEYNKLLMKLNREIERTCKNLKFCNIAVPVFSLQIGSRWSIGWTYGKTWRAEVSHAMHRIIALAESGVLHRLRRCRWCKAWFFARFNHGRYCRERCQQSAYWSTEEWKEHRRRKYRKQRHGGKG